MKRWTSRIAALCAVALLVAMGGSVAGSPIPESSQPAGVGAQTDSVTLTAVADAGLYSAYPGINFGSSPNMHTAMTSSFLSASLVRFDVAASIPAGAVIDSAVMRLYMHLVDPSFNDLANVSIGAYYVTSPWIEYTVTFNSAPNADPLGTSANVSTAVGWKSWNVTNWAQLWLDNPASNNGVFLYGPRSGPQYNRSYYTREAGSNRPHLAITYHVPLCVLQTQIPRAECEALEDLYNSTNGPGWTTHTGWLSALWPCTWYGVTCSGGHVQQLSLGDNNLNGSIPSSLGNLPHLAYLWLFHNQLSGSIPSSLGNLSSLRRMSLDRNQLNGSIPSSLGNLSSLRELWLNNNQLTGGIPLSLSNLSNLETLSLFENQLDGSIPSSLGSMPSLEGLFLDRNQFSGSIPSSLGNLSTLLGLQLNDNQLTGGVPDSLGGLSALRNLRVNGNSLGGALPQSLKNLSLTYFYFGITEICEPPDAAFQAWLAGIPNLWRTGVLCGSASPTPTPTPTPTGEPGTRTYLPIVMRQFAPAPPSAVIFSDDFNEGTLSGWTRNNGNWYNAGDYMHGDYALGNAWNIKNVSGSDFTYEGDVNIVSGNAVGLVFRSSADGTASYDAILDAVTNVFKISKRPGYTVLASYPMGVSRNHWYHVKVVVSGTKIEGYLDGAKRLTTYDSNFSSGQFGVMLFQGTGAYDNLEARTLP